MRRRIVATCIALFVAATSLTACKSTGYSLRYEPSGAPLTGAGAESLAAKTDIAALAKTPTSDAPALRDKVLQDLRLKGSEGARIADLLTQGFPPKTAAVPALVRLSSVDGTSAVVVVEAFGDSGGTLTHRRLWVFALSSGALVRAASFQ